MKISIIVPIYNEEKLVAECLNVLISQNYAKEDYEIVVVNDGSTDNTLEIIKRKQKEAKEKDVKMKIVNLEKNQGRVITRETGIKNAKYDNLLFIDSRCTADKYVKFMGRGDEFYETLYSYHQLKNLLCDFEIFDYTRNILNEPDKFYASDETFRFRFINKLVGRLYFILKYIFPGLIFVFKKP